MKSSVLFVGVIVAGGFLAASAPRRPGGARALEPAADPVRILPSPARRGAPLDLPRGEVLLFTFLKALADHTGETFYLEGGVPPEQTIELERAFKKLDAESARALLAAQGFSMTRELYRKQKVLWVQRRLSRERKVGGIVRRGEGGAREAPRAAPGTRSPALPLPASSTPALRLFQRADGATAAPTYLVQFETSSRDEAAEVMSLIEAALRARKR
jgi:hypothetical protein